MRVRVMGLVIGALLFGAGTGWAQVAWDAPLFVPPRAEAGYGIYLFDAAEGDIGVVGTFRPASSPGLGFRLGIADDFDGISVLGGIDYSRLLTTASADFPLDIGWVLGAGAGIGDVVLLSFPAGLTVGRTFTEEEVSFTPFASPRVVLDATLGNEVADDELNLDLAVDVGLDLAFEPNWKIRFSGTFGDREAIGVGLVF